MACVTCGKQFDNDFKAIVKRKKEEYEKYGIGYYIYKVGSEFAIIKREYFQAILQDGKDLEYWHISEFEIN